MDNSVFFGAFAAAGMLKNITWHASGGDQTVSVGYFRPTELQFGSVDVTKHTIEYSLNEIALVRGEQVTIDAKRYKIARVVTKGDGYFVISELEPI